MNDIMNMIGFVEDLFYLKGFILISIVCFSLSNYIFIILYKLLFYVTGSCMGDRQFKQRGIISIYLIIIFFLWKKNKLDHFICQLAQVAVLTFLFLLAIKILILKL